MAAVKSFSIGSFCFDSNSRVMIIAELSANHGQSKEIAIETIKAAKRSGADAIKLQTYTPDTMTIDCHQESFTSVLKGSIWEGYNLYDLYKEAYTPWEWHQDLFRIANEIGLICFSTPFDKTSVDFLEQFNPPAYKIASFEIQDIPLIKYIASKGRPLIISTGIADIDDIELALSTCYSVNNNQIVLLKCTSSYPAPIEEANLLMINDFSNRFNVISGLSDHTVGITLPVVATALGARVIEKHFILDKSIGGPDSSFSLDANEFGEMVKAVREAEKSIGVVDYKLTEKQIKGRKFGRSLYVIEDMKVGDFFSDTNIRSIRPGLGMHPKHYYDIIGKRAKINIKRGTPLNDKMIDE